MARYRRNFIASGTFFFTVKLADPKSRLLVEHISLLRAAYMNVQKQYPFETVAVCVLPNHIHAIWTLPPDDADYSLRWRLIKTKFSDISLVPKTCLPANSKRRLGLDPTKP